MINNLMESSTVRGSGRSPLKSSRKNDRVGLLEFRTAKLRSPMKRSMNELNKIAYENAIKNRPILTDESDALDENELTIINKIIKLSKLDNMNGLELEEDEKSEFELSDDEEIINSQPKKKLKIESLQDEIKKPELPLQKSIPLITHEPIPPNSISISPVSSVSPVKSPLKFVIKSEPGTPIHSPLKSKQTDSNTSSQLRRSARQKHTILEKLNEVSNDSTPRKKNRKNLQSTFNSLNNLKPPHADKIQYMEVPNVEPSDDELLMNDPKAKQKTLYHDGFEAYFEQNNTRVRTSKSSMSMAPEITYEEFAKYNKFLDLICSEPIESLNLLYQFQFTQWLFELKENFNLIFYGIGSKRSILTQFLREFVLPTEPHSKCIVINGYNPEFTIRLLLKEIWTVCFNKALQSRELREACNLTHVEFMKPKNRNRRLYILLNNIDGEPLRNDDLQYMLSQIARIEQVSLIGSLDNLNTPLFWDASVLSNYNFIWHNISTFTGYNTEVSFKDPLSTGKTDELIGSRGAKYVLSSLTGNAKSLYKNLILQQLDRIDTFIGDDTKLLDNRGSVKGSSKTCISLREFYDICVSEFIISNDISFRTILGEFVEHKMCILTRDTAGTEILYIAFSVDELEKLLDEELID